MLTSGAYGYLGDYLLWGVLCGSLLVHTWCFFRIFPRTRLRRIRLVVGNSLVFLCLIAVLALAGETYLRFAAVYTDAFGMSLPARRWFILHTQLNSFDCRDREWSIDKTPGVHRIAFVGDSFTYGWGIERVEDRFADLLAARFEQRTPGRVDVWNVAKPGGDTLEQLEVIRNMQSLFHVDEVVLCYVPNDIEKQLGVTDSFDPTQPPTMALLNPDSSCLVNFLFQRFWVPNAPTVRGYHDWLAEGYANTSTWERQRETLIQLIQSCRDQKITLRVALLPFIRTGGAQYDETRIHDQLATLFTKQGVPVVDLRNAIAGRDRNALMVSGHDAHPNEEAHRLFADALWKAFYEEDDR